MSSDPWVTGTAASDCISNLMKKKSSTHPPPMTTQPSLTSFVPATSKSLKITISEPQKHGEGSAAFVTYLVNYTTVLDIYSAPEASVRRRFQDFIWLSKNLSEEHPACILPPLPGKHRMEYITGDRFSPEFIEKRRSCLECYLISIARHPLLQSSISLRRFLESSDIHPVEHTLKQKESHVFENIGDAILNAFTKVRKVDPKFLEMKDNATKLEENLSGVEKVHSKMLKTQSGKFYQKTCLILADLSVTMKQFGDAIASLSNMESQMASSLNTLGTRLDNYATFIKNKSLHEELDYVVFVRHYVAYCESVKDLLKARDQRQVDHEELSAWYANYQTERDRTAGGRSTGGITGFFKDKINDFKGIDPEKARQDRVLKLNAKVSELESAVESSQKEAEAFSEQVVKEVGIFESIKTEDFKGYLRDLSDVEIEFHQKVSCARLNLQGLKFWESMIPVMNEMGHENPVEASISV